LIYRQYVKFIIDFIGALLVLTISLPISTPVTIALWIVNSGNPFFIQKRPGYLARPFKLFKFKTMNDKKDAKGNLLPDHLRLTPIGKWVRKFSLDELPQLLNVIKGDMSLIGPRPWLMEYLPMMNDFQKRRHEVRPGISGWAQVNGRNMISWEERFEYDIYYVDHISFALDMKIFILTIWNIITAKGISGQNSVTMTKFKGNA
jgi:undecaprenyl phosphate N,N'-diacetylbacillosamine 1-phosphate transferase